MLFIIFINIYIHIQVFPDLIKKMVVSKSNVYVVLGEPGTLLLLTMWTV